MQRAAILRDGCLGDLILHHWWRNGVHGASRRSWTSWTVSLYVKSGLVANVDALEFVEDDSRQSCRGFPDSVSSLDPSVP